MKDAIILLNMGGPNNVDEAEVFLKNMFNDENIITVKSKLLRKFIASMIVMLRKKESKEIYKKIGGKSPMVDLSKKIAKSLEKELNNTKVYYAMRYTPPFSKEIIQKIEKENIKDIYLIPLYPQYSTTTTKSSFEDIYKILDTKDFNVKKIDKFYDHKKYNLAIVDRIKETINKDNEKEFDLIFSAHGLPQKIVDNGDVYEKEINLNVNILKEMLLEKGLNFNKIHLAYQSKVGPMKWLSPSLDDKLKEITNKKVIIYPIAFIVDNSETIYELDMEYRELSQELLFEDFRVCKCLNNHPLFIEFLKETYLNLKN